MRSLPAVLVALLLGFCLAMACEAAVDLSRDLERLERLREAVDVQADRIEYDEAERKIVARGAVRVALGNRFLFADEVSVDLDDETLVASGNVILMEGLNRLEGDRIEYNYRSNVGVIANGRGTLDPGVSFSGVEIRREGERQYSLKEGRFTGCSVCQPESRTPDWEFRADEATIYQDEWIAARSASFWIKGVPALYAPVLALPIGPRRTGFLIPRFGYGNRDGFAIKQPFFWAISRSQDATLTAIYRTKRGFEIDGQYRYVLGERSRGELSGRYLHDWDSGDKPADRGEARWFHDQILSPTWTFKADARYQSDTRLNRDFMDNSVADAHSASSTPTSSSRRPPRYMLLGLLGVTEDLTDVGRNGFRASPKSVSMSSPRRSLPCPGGGGETSAVYFERSQADNAGRFDLFPRSTSRWRLFRGSLQPPAWSARDSVLLAAHRRRHNRFLVDLGQRFGSIFCVGSTTGLRSLG
jgi:LPS-assembly protein